MDAETHLKRLRYRSWHRGCKETDLILGRFADSGMADLATPLLAVYERLLKESDADIWDWITGKDAPADYAPLLAILREKVTGD